MNEIPETLRPFVRGREDDPEMGPERVVDGIDQVLAILVDPELLWVFLIEEQPFEDEVARPIDKLKAGQIDDVVGAARAYGSTPA